MKHFRMRSIPVAIAALFGGGAAMAADFDDRFYVAPMASYVLADDARESDDGWGGVLAIGKRLSPHFELELRGNYLKYDANDTRPRLLGIPIGPEPEDTELYAGGIGANLFLSESGRGLFLHVDAMTGDSTLLNAGVGFDLGGDNVALRFEALYHDDDSDFQETQFNLGLRIPIGARPAPKPRPQPVAVVPVPPPPPPPPPACSDGVDNDGDGLIDYPSDSGCDSISDADEWNPAPCEAPAPGQPVSLDGCKTGDTIVLHGVNFEFDKSTLTVNAKTLLDQVADALAANPDIIVEIDGHTDSMGSESYNLKLSEARAESVMAYLNERGVAASRMSSKGYGESMPVADNQTDEGRELNRRVELKILSGGEVAVTVAPAKTAAPPPEPASAPAPMADPAPAPAEPAASAAPAAAGSGPAAVSIGFMTFEPEVLTIPAGTTVTWTNHDGSNHVVQFPDQKSPRLREEEQYSRSFDQPGEYSYQCAIHGKRMSGKVIVTAP